MFDEAICALNSKAETAEQDKQTLLEKNGLYARLWKRQTGGYIADAIEPT